MVSNLLGIRELVIELDSKVEQSLLEGWGVAILSVWPTCC